jgi:Zn-dependent peptidase ImmA (M78 family)/transcriptional regulator with XRE-family HTH domain
VLTGSVSRVTALETVRLARGMTQAQLADAAGVSQATISKAESGTAPLTDERLNQVAAALRVPPGLLRGNQLPVAAVTACVFHRKRASTTIGQARQARARLALARVRAQALLDLVGIPEATLIRMSPSRDGFVSAEDVAKQVRSALGVPTGPVQNLVVALEQAGAVVIQEDLGGRRLDALSDWPPGGRPVLFVNSEAPGDRQRFTLAHETGHAVMHAVLADGIEGEADNFASELLMPAADIRDELDGLTLERLLVLKQRWKVSAAALVRRAYDLGALNDYEYRRLNTEMSASGWRTAEPIPIPSEQPTLLVDALRRARDRYDDRYIAAHVCVLPELLDETFADRRSA